MPSLPAILTIDRNQAIAPARRFRITAISYKLLSHVSNAGGSDVDQETPVGRDMRGDVVRWRGKRAGRCSYGAPAAGRRGASGTGIACGLGMDTRILPLERETVYLGSGTLGGATPASRNLGARPMGSSRRWMGLGQRILALEPAARARVKKIKLTPTGRGRHASARQ